MRVSVVIPTYNEARSIGLVLADIPAGIVQQVVVVDSDSTDGTAQVARQMGAEVLHEPRRGYGRACLTGLAAVNAPDVVVFLDGDYSDRPAEMSRLLEPLRNGAADIVIGSRLAGERMAGSMPWHAVAGNRLAARLIAFLSGVRLTDLGPFRAARYQALIALGLRESTYGWPVEMIVKGARRGLRITEVPVSYHPRIGSSKISGTLRGSIGAAWGILGAILKYQLFDTTFHTRGESLKRAHSENRERALIIMAKAPRVGHVKTRLAASLPAEAVVDLYRSMLEDTLDLAGSVSTDIVAIVCPAADVGDLSSWLPAIEIAGQQGEGLAAGLSSAFRIFINRGYRRVVALDGDSPQLPPETLDKAFQALDRADVVVGPTTDGGYYLVGSKTVQAELFDTQGMGTGSALDSLMATSRGLGLRVALTETSYDVDEAEDLARLARDLRLLPHRAPRTAAWLAHRPELGGC